MLFFVVVGTLIQPSAVIEAVPFAALVLLLMVLLKTFPTMLLARVGKMKVRHSLLGIGVSQIGEFSFVLSSLAFAQGEISSSQYTGVLLAVVLSISGSTILVRLAPKKG